MKRVSYIYCLRDCKNRSFIFSSCLQFLSHSCLCSNWLQLLLGCNKINIGSCEPFTCNYVQKMRLPIQACFHRETISYFNMPESLSFATLSNAAFTWPSKLDGSWGMPLNNGLESCKQIPFWRCCWKLKYWRRLLTRKNANGPFHQRSYLRGKAWPWQQILELAI